MKQSDPGLGRKLVLWGLRSSSGLWEERERGGNSTYKLPEQGGCTTTDALGRTGIYSDKVTKLPSSNVNSSL